MQTTRITTACPNCHGAGEFHIVASRRTTVREQCSWCRGGGSVSRTVLFQDTVARYDEHRAEWWLMNRPEQGWASYGIGFPTLRSIEREYAVRVGAESADKFGAFVPVARLESEAA